METERLILRPWRESDAEALFKYASGEYFIKQILEKCVI